MTCDTLELYLDNIDSFIKDGDKLVTYKWLSKELEIHVNTAKNILEKYWESHKNDVDATFLVKGKLPDGSLRLEVTRASNLSNTKKKFTTLDFEHIYSVQKTLPNLELLASAGEGDVQFSAIKFSKNVLRTEKAKQIISPSIESPKKPLKKDLPKVANVEKPAKESSPKAEESDVKEKEKDEKKAEVVKSKSSESSQKSKSESAPKSKTAKKPVQSTKTGFSNLFGKVANQPKPPPKVEKPPEPVKEKPVVKEKSIEKDSPPKEKDTKKEAAKPSVSSQKTSKSGSGKEKQKPQQSQKRKSKTSKESTDKKRKRIIAQLEDSSDDDSADKISDHSEPEEIIDEPKPKKRISPSPIAVGPGKVKVRKMVSQTTQDEDGYFHTEQVAVFEEIDVEAEPKPEPKKVEAPKNKQTKLTNFFKRS